MLTGQNGILNRAGEAGIQTDIAGTKEQIKLEIVGRYDNKGNYTNDDVIEAVKAVTGQTVNEGDATVTTAKGNEVDISDLWRTGTSIGGEINQDGAVTLQIGDYVNYDANVGATDTTYISSLSLNGYGDQEFTTASYTDGWRVLGVENEQIVLIPATSVKTSSGGYYYLNGQAGYINAIDELNKISALYGQGKYATGARSITVEDVNKITGYDPANPANGAVAKYGADSAEEYGNKVTYYWNGTDYNYYCGSNGASGCLSTINWNGFTYWNGKEFVTISKSTTATTSAMEEITTLTSDCYRYYPHSYTTDPYGDTVGIELTSNKFSVLFSNTVTNRYWLGSRYVETTVWDAYFGVHIVRGNEKDSENLFFAWGDNEGDGLRV